MASAASFVPSTEALSEHPAYKTVQLTTLPENQYFTCFHTDRQAEELVGVVKE